MSTYNILVNDGTCFIMVIPYHKVTGSEILRRLSLKRDWNYVISCKPKKSPIIFIYPNDSNLSTNNFETIVPTNSTIRLFKRPVEPIINCNNYYIEQIKNKFKLLPNVNYMLVWFNYNLFYKPEEPYNLIFIYKNNNCWFEEMKTSYSSEIKDVITNKLYDGLFIITDQALERFNELFDMYG